MEVVARFVEVSLQDPPCRRSFLGSNCIELVESYNCEVVLGEATCLPVPMKWKSVKPSMDCMPELVEEADDSLDEQEVYSVQTESPSLLDQPPVPYLPLAPQTYQLEWIQYRFVGDKECHWAVSMEHPRCQPPRSNEDPHSAEQVLIRQKDVEQYRGPREGPPERAQPLGGGTIKVVSFVAKSVCVMN